LGSRRFYRTTGGSASFSKPTVSRKEKKVTRESSKGGKKGEGMSQKNPHGDSNSLITSGRSQRTRQKKMSSPKKEEGPDVKTRL